MHNLFKLSIDRDYYKPLLVKSGYNNYIQFESKGDKILTLKEYLALIEQCLRELINDYKNKGEWKLQLIAEINFISLKPGSDETRAMHTKSDIEEIMTGSDTDEIIEELESFLQTHEQNLEEKMKSSDFEFDSVNFLYYDFNNEDFYCLSCFCTYATKNKPEEHKKICGNNKYCHVEMPNEDNEIIKYNQGEKSIKSPFIIYVDLECLLEKMSNCYNNPKESSTTEINKYAPSGYSLFI